MNEVYTIHYYTIFVFEYKYTILYRLIACDDGIL